LLANLDGRYIAYIGEDFKVSVYDTKELKVERAIKLSITEDDDVWAEDLAVVSKDRIALLTDSGLVYIVNWKKRKMEYSVDVKITTTYNRLNPIEYTT
jgi:hypothetical protein